MSSASRSVDLLTSSEKDRMLRLLHSLCIRLSRGLGADRLTTDPDEDDITEKAKQALSAHLASLTTADVEALHEAAENSKRAAQTSSEAAPSKRPRRG